MDSQTASEFGLEKREKDFIDTGQENNRTLFTLVSSYIVNFFIKDTFFFRHFLVKEVTLI